MFSEETKAQFESLKSSITDQIDEATEFLEVNSNRLFTALGDGLDAAKSSWKDEK